MEQIAPRSQHQWQSPTRLFHLLPYLLVVLIVWMGFTIVSLGAQALGHNAEPPTNPFATFAHVFPGQPGSAIQGYGLLCSRGLYNYLPNEHCTVNPTEGTFSQVGVVISDGVIDEISFRMRDNTFRLGDLMLLLGKPEVREFSRSVYLFWRDIGVTAMVTEYAGHFSPFLRLRRVIIAHADVQLSLRLP